MLYCILCDINFGVITWILKITPNDRIKSYLLLLKIKCLFLKILLSPLCREVEGENSNKIIHDNINL